jgi:hypothetical protein
VCNLSYTLNKARAGAVDPANRDWAYRLCSRGIIGTSHLRMLTRITITYATFCCGPCRIRRRRATASRLLGIFSTQLAVRRSPLTTSRHLHPASITGSRRPPSSRPSLSARADAQLFVAVSCVLSSALALLLKGSTIGGHLRLNKTFFAIRNFWSKTA